LTEMYFELRDEKQTTTLPSSDDPLFVFTNKNRNRFAYTLMLVIERSYRALLDRENEPEDEEITNQELLSELRKRIKERRIEFNLSAADTKNPPIIDENTGQEMKECEGCYCQLFADSHNDFCCGCLGCKSRGCQFGCCDCYSDGSVGWKDSDGGTSAQS
ncbi:6968_t:CDS:2, partial [Scutellospora calospora]